jgi:hypothetical protein
MVQDLRNIPSDWKVTDTGNGNITALSVSTNEKFTGTIDQFNTYVKGLRASTNYGIELPADSQLVLAKVNPSGSGIEIEDGVPTRAILTAEYAAVYVEDSASEAQEFYFSNTEGA